MITNKQRTSRIQNFSLFRLKGMLAAVRNICNSKENGVGTYSVLQATIAINTIINQIKIKQGKYNESQGPPTPK